MARHDETPSLAIDDPVADRRVKSAFASLRDRASSTPDTPTGDLGDGSYEGTGECGPSCQQSANSPHEREKH